MKKLVLMMTFVLGVSAMAYDCCEVKNNEKCNCPTEKKQKIAIVKLNIHKMQKLKQKLRQKKQ